MRRFAESVKYFLNDRLAIDQPQARPGDADQEEGRLRPGPRRSEAFVPPPIDREITIAEGVTVKELSEKLGVKANDLMRYPISCDVLGEWQMVSSKQ